MSWSVDFTGTPEAVCRELDAECARLAGASKEEFDGVLPALKTVVSANCNKNYPSQAMRLVASGHASRGADGAYTYSSCLVRLESVGKIVT